jgi:hypothetical protein
VPTVRSAAHDAAPRARPLPTLLALLGFAPLVALVWWALAGPRPEPTPLDWSELGFEVHAGSGELELPLVYDLEWVQAGMIGWQADLGGRLDEPRPVAAGRYAAVVRRGEASGLAPLSELAGVLEWSVDGDGVGRCAFGQPVTLDRVRATLDDLDPEVELDVSALSGRCTDEGPIVAVPLVRRHVVPLTLTQRLAGQRAESAAVPDGVVLVEADGSISHRHDLDPEAGLAAYPWEVARDALLHAHPDNPAAGAGSWAEPIYPLAVAAQDRLWWVLPLAPRDGTDVTSGYLLTAADELHAGSLNPIEEHWLERPETGVGTVTRWTQELLDELGADEDPAIRPTLPSRDGAWHGRVSTAEAPLRYVLEASAGGGMCLLEPDGRSVACRQAGETSRQ